MTTTTLPSIAILGAGSLGSAILNGLVSPDVRVEGGIVVTNRSVAKARALDALEGVRSVALEEEPGANRQAAAAASIVVIGVKPGMVVDLLHEIRSDLTPGTIVVSVAAGVTIETFEANLPEGVAVIRSMPNTPALVGRAVTGISPGTRSTPEQLALTRELFETVGDVLEVPEDQIDALSTISGSGPAYVFLMMEELTKTAIAKGFTPDEARTMVEGTFRGATELLHESGQTPEELRRQVTSPKGTTERAIAVMQQADFAAIFDEATDAALARARELAG
jgi:pyrroline-5-carboxylate reductase